MTLFFHLLLLMFSFKGHAWGPTGHRVVGAVAEQHLQPGTKKRLNDFLKGPSLAKVSTWADEIKSEPQKYAHTFNWHYTQWGDQNLKPDETKGEGKLLTSLKKHIKNLKDSKSSSESKVFSLKMVVHLMGDLHQPLHVGSGLDRGGNTCKVFFHDRPTNLHSLWDEGMIDFTKLSYTELAQFVSQGRSDKELKEWLKGDLESWALESKKVRSLLYPEEVVRFKRSTSFPNYCSDKVNLKEKYRPRLGYEYSYQWLNVIEKRLFQAGIRLAHVLNQNLK